MRRHAQDRPPVADPVITEASTSIKAIEGGVAAVRINPASRPDKVELVVNAAEQAGIPMRIGANSGSAAQTPGRRATRPGRGARRGGGRGGGAWRPSTTGSRSQPRRDDGGPRMLSEKVAAARLRVTEAGTPFAGSIKSAVGMGTGARLVDGIGDTVRVSLTADPGHEEVKTALGARPARARADRDSVPPCGRDNVGPDAPPRRSSSDSPATRSVEVAVLGCAVEQTGEAANTDFGSRRPRCRFVYAHGRV